MKIASVDWRSSNAHYSGHTGSNNKTTHSHIRKHSQKYIKQNKKCVHSSVSLPFIAYGLSMQPFFSVAHFFVCVFAWGSVYFHFDFHCFCFVYLILSTFLSLRLRIVCRAFPIMCKWILPSHRKIEI